MVVVFCSKGTVTEGFTSSLTISIPTDNATRTIYDAEHIKWLSTDLMALNITTIGHADASISIAPDGKATFTRSVSISTAGWYRTQGVVPSSAYVVTDSDIDTPSKLINGYALTLPAEQSCTNTSFDSKADILVSNIIDFEVTGDDIISGSKTVEGAFRYTRPFAIAKFTFKNASDAYAEDNVNSATIRFSDYYVAGSARQFDIESCTFVDSEGKTFENVQDAFYKDASYKIYVTTADHPKVKDLVLWVVMAPIDAKNGTMSISIDTDQYRIEKTIDLGSKSLRFEKNCLNTATVSLSTSTEYTKKEGGVFTLVKSESELRSSDQVIIAAHAKNYALGTQSSNNRSQESITKSDDNGTLTKIGSDVAILTLGGNTGAWTLYDPTNEGYLYAASSSSNYLRTQSKNDSNGEWTISIASTKATITANGSNARNRIFHNEGSSVFSCYSPSSTSMKDVVIYRLSGTKLDAPSLKASTDKTALTATASWSAVEGARNYTLRCTGRDDMEIADNGSASYSHTFTGLEKGVEYTISVTANPYDDSTIPSSSSTKVIISDGGPYTGCMETPSVSPSSTTPTVISTPAAYGRELVLPVKDHSTQKIVIHEFDDYGSTTGTSMGQWHRNYTMLYDNSKYAALWVAYSLSSWHFPLSSSMSRPSSWYTDPAVTQYSGGYQQSSTYDRGHQCANMTRNKCSYKAQMQTFFHSNQTPQVNTFNQGQWNALEDKEMIWYQECDTMYVVTGPIFDPGYITTNDKNGTPIPVPTRYFKAFLKCSWTGGSLSSAKAIGFIMDNDANAAKYSNSVASVSEIENETGFKLFANLPEAFDDVRDNKTPSAFTSNW